MLTGGLGRLGTAYRDALLARGARVAIFDLVAGEDAWEPQLATLHADVTSRQSLTEVLRKVIERWGVPHGLINNAGLDSPPDAPASENGPFEHYPEGSFDKIMDVNVKGVFLACQTVGTCMAEAGRGSIVNISSIYGLVSPDQRIYDFRRAGGQEFFKPVAYSVSKSALLNLTRYLATYWASQAVRVNTLTLGGVYDGQPDEFVEQYCARVPLGRMAQAADYGGAIIFLLSEASRYMTGANLIIDGGWTAW